MLRVNGLFGTSQFGSPSHTYPLPVKFGPDGSLYVATWGHRLLPRAAADAASRAG